MAKAKSKTRYNFGYGAIYQRKTKNGVRWYLDYRDGNGKRIQKVAPLALTKEEAAIALRDDIAKTFSREYGLDQKKKQISFNEFAQVYLRDYIMITRRNWYSDAIRKKKLVEYFNDTELQQVNPSKIRKFRDYRLKEANSKSTLNRYLALLKKMFNLAIEEGYLNENPVKKVKFFSEKDTLKERILTDEEEKRFLNTSSDHLKAIIVVALNTGMRLGEILSLKWDQVDLKNRQIKVEKTKSGKIRFININTPLFFEFEKLRKKSAQDLYVFTNPKTQKPFTTIKTAFYAACRRAKLQNLRFHDLRHTFGSRLVEKGVDLITVKDLLGHSTVKITERYTHSNQEQKRRAVELLAEKPKKSPKKQGDLLHICDMEKMRERKESVWKSVNPYFSMN